MTEQPQPSKPERKVSEEFAAVQAELNSEDNLFAMMREQLPSMLGMAFMFILTIALSLFIRPWYDIANLQAFGAAGAKQVRYIALELFMIFVFTAFILLLAKYKKEWIIKYGIMGVLSIALMYTTVPLAHMLVLDLEVETFAYENENEFEMSYLSHHGLDTHLTNTLLQSPGNLTDSISVYHGEEMVNGTPTWTMTQERLSFDDTGELRVVVSDQYYSFTNQGYIWYVDAETGELQQSYACHRYVDDGEGNFNFEFIGSLLGACSLAFHADDAMYVINENNVLVRFNTFDESPGELFYQAGWNLPPELQTHYGVEYAELIDDNKVLIVTPNMAVVVELEKTAPSFDPLAPEGVYSEAKVLFKMNATSNFTSADFGHSPWSENMMNESDAQEGFLLLGEENGDVVGIEWNEEEFTPQTKMNLLGYADSIQSVRITDLDESGWSDLLITTDESASWHHGPLLKKKISFPVSENLSTSWFGQSENSSQFHAVYDNGSISIQSGIITNEMLAIEGLQLEDGPLLAGLLVAIILMILLYVHSEWYVVNTVGVLVGSGVIVMLGVTFVPTLIIIFMIAAAVYDAWAVYHSKHMLVLADTMIGLRLPILLVAPQEKGYSFIEETVSMKEKNVEPSQRPSATSAPKKKGKDAMFMGLGDVIFPGMLVLSAAQYIDGTDGFLVAMTTLLGGLVGYFALMTYVARGRAQAGLPLLNGGAILGYIIGGLLIVGTAIFDFGITL